MYTYQSHPDVTRATLSERAHRAPRTGLRRSARLISLEIRRSRRTQQRR